jgi:hypothetical protein
VSFLKRWRVFSRPSLGTVALAVASWVAVVTALHVGVNSRRPLSRAAEARSLPVGGLPVT